jgi:hypothetical protein
MIESKVSTDSKISKRNQKHEGHAEIFQMSIHESDDETFNQIIGQFMKIRNTVVESKLRNIGEKVISSLN